MQRKKNYNPMNNTVHQSFKLIQKSAKINIKMDCQGFTTELLERKK